MKKVSSFLSDLQAFQYSKTVSAPRVSIQRGARKTKTLGKNAYVYRLVMNAKLIETAKIQSAKFITFFADPEKQDLYFTVSESPNNNMLSVTQGKNNIYSVFCNVFL